MSATVLPAALAPEVDDELRALLRRVGEHCPLSFRRLYALTCDQLFGIVCRINRDRAEAEDVLQDVYVKVWSQSAQFDGSRGRPIHWLSGIAHHAAIDSLRRRSARPDRQHFTAPFCEDDPYVGLASGDADPLDHVMNLASANAVRQCLASLSAEQRQSLTLAFFDGLSYPQIAQRMGRPASTVKSWVRRTLRVMRGGLSAHR